MLDKDILNKCGDLGHSFGTQRIYGLYEFVLLQSNDFLISWQTWDLGSQMAPKINSVTLLSDKTNI